MNVLWGKHYYVEIRTPIKRDLLLLLSLVELNCPTPILNYASQKKRSPNDEEEVTGKFWVIVAMAFKWAMKSNVLVDWPSLGCQNLPSYMRIAYDINHDKYP